MLIFSYTIKERGEVKTYGVFATKTGTEEEEIFPDEFPEEFKNQ